MPKQTRNTDQLSPQQRADLVNDARCMHAMLLQVEGAIKTGALTDVTLAVLPFVFGEYKAALGCAVVNNRIYEELSCVVLDLLAPHWFGVTAHKEALGAALYKFVHHALASRPTSLASSSSAASTVHKNIRTF